MGWTFTRQTGLDKSFFVNNMIQEHSPRIQEHQVCGNEVWAIAKSHNGTQYITLFLVKKHKGFWGYKEIDESMGPYYYKCPKKFIDKVPATCKVSEQWRERWAEEQERKKFKIEIGKTYLLHSGKKVLIVGKLPRGWLGIHEETQYQYRVYPKDVAKV